MTRRKYLTGDDVIERSLTRLGDNKTADRMAKSILGAALGVDKRAIKAEAPVGPTKETRGSIASRLDRSKRSGFVRAKVGIDVGPAKKNKPKTKSEHAFIVGLRMHFVPRAFEAARGAATKAMRERAIKRLTAEAAKARR